MRVVDSLRESTNRVRQPVPLKRQDAGVPIIDCDRIAPLSRRRIDRFSERIDHGAHTFGISNPGRGVRAIRAAAWSSPVMVLVARESNAATAS